MDDLKTTIQKRMGATRVWLHEEAPYIDGDQKHLDSNTPERAYWHYGYLAALEDIVALIERSS
jgi:hypothetical protein